MEYKASNKTIIVRLARGEEVVASLVKLMDDLNINAARVSGIGATDNATVGVYDVKNQRYTKVTLTEDMEILNLSGNLSRKDGTPYVHVHVTLASLTSVYGGHLNEAVICATCEMILDVLDTTIERTYDEETGLNLFKL